MGPSAVQSGAVTACATLGRIAFVTIALAAAAHSAIAQPVASDARVKGDDRATSFTLVLSAAVEPRTFLLADPPRLVIELPETAFQLARDAGRKGQGLVKSFRFGSFAAGKARIVIDLAQPATIDSVTSTKGPAGAVDFTLLTVELRRADRALFLNSVQQPETPGPTGGPVTDTRSTERRGERRVVVVIDPGHGGVDPGAQTRNVSEKDLVFAFSMALRDALHASGRYDVVLTRDRDVFVSLADRVRRARGASADLFISIHADTIADAAGVRGATVYTGSDMASDPAAARLALKENLADVAAGAEPKEKQVDALTDILEDLTKRETRSFSQYFARSLVTRMRGTLALNKNPQRSAGFRVLTAPDVPSVLLELGYLTSAQDLEQLSSSAWRMEVAGAIGSAIDAFFAGRVPRTPPLTPDIGGSDAARP